MDGKKEMSQKAVAEDILLIESTDGGTEALIERQKSTQKRLLTYAICIQITQARKEQNMTQEELAKKAGTQKSHISRLESGKQTPSLDLLVRIAAALGKELSVELK